MVRRKGKATKNGSKDRTADIQTRKYSHKRGFQVLREIKRLQKEVSLLIPKASFSRLVREVLQNFSGIAPGFRMTTGSLEALHESVEMYMVQFFEDSYLCTLHAHRKTLMVTDMQLCRRLRGIGDVINA